MLARPERTHRVFGVHRIGQNDGDDVYLGVVGTASINVLLLALADVV